MTKNPRIQVALPDGLLAYLKDLSNATGKSRSRIFKELLDQHARQAELRPKEGASSARG
jgi:metal-responsive CopG/Arc/MetJ family transcriptional regulator